MQYRHLTEEELELFHRGSLDIEILRLINRHFDQCEWCAERLAAMLEKIRLLGPRCGAS